MVTASSQVAKWEGSKQRTLHTSCQALLIAVLVSTAAIAQSWTPAFNHNTAPPHAPGTGTFTSPYVPWGAPTGIVTSIAPAAGMQFFVVSGQPLEWPATFNAVHMAIIPKGPYQGMVLVWNVIPVVARDPSTAPPHPPNSWRSFQPYAIIDPANTPSIGTPGDPPARYRNRLLPIGPIVSVNSTTGLLPVSDIFCSGHTWSNFGDLIVVGGTVFTTVFLGARMTLAWNADDPVQDYPGTATQMYPGYGLWVQGPLLEQARWYPTPVLTYPLPRTATGTPPREVVLVLGGSNQDPASAGCQPGPGTQATWNSIEGMVVNARASAASAGLIKDVLGPGILNPGSNFVADGPGTLGGSPDIDWMEEYPRCHLLSTGDVFVSGYAPRWSYIDPNTVPITTMQWNRDPGPVYSSTWNFPRHDAPCILLPGFGDRVMRIGGAATHFYQDNAVGTTETVESIVVPSPTAAWQPEESMPPPPALLPPPPIQTFDPALGARYLHNAVVLPTGAIFVVGGVRRDPSECNEGSTPVLASLLFENGKWYDMPDAGSVRDYHSTAVLLPDGRVFVGGGNGRNFDYEIFLPKYRTDATLIAQKPTNPVFNPPPFFDVRYDAYELSYIGTGTTITYRVDFTALPPAVTLDKVVLIAPASLTHHSDMSARSITLPIIARQNNSVSFAGPFDPKQAPRGVYMLFLVTNTGAVSDALWVFLS